MQEISKIQTPKQMEKQNISVSHYKTRRNSEFQQVLEPTFTNPILASLSRKVSVPINISCQIQKPSWVKKDVAALYSGLLVIQ